MSEFNENNQENIAEFNSVENPANETENMFSSEPQPVADDAEIVSGVEVKKGGVGKIIAILVAVIVLLFGAAGASYAFIPQVKNTVKMLVNSPAEYYAWVESENTSIFTELIDKLDTEKEMNSQASYTISIDGKNVDALIKNNTGESLEENGMKFPATVSVEQKSMKVDECYTVNQKVAFDGTDLLTYNCYIKDGKFYYQIPELSSAYLCMDLSENMAAIMDTAAEEGSIAVVGDSEKMEAALNNLLSKAAKGEEIVSNKDLKTFITKYTDILFENIKNVKIEKNVKCEAGGVKGECTKLTADIDEGTIFEFLKDALKELKNDEIVLDFVVNNFGISKEEYQQFIDDAIEETSKYEISGGDSVASMNVYVNSKGEIVGREFIYATALDIEKFGYNIINDGSNYGISIFTANGGEKNEIYGKLTEKNGKYTGDINIADAAMISVKDFSCSEKFIDGEITFDLSTLELDDITLIFEEKDSEQHFSMDITYEGTKLGSISGKASDKKPETITVFNEEAKVYSLTDEAEQYFEDSKVEEFIMNIFEVLGINEENAQEILGQLMGSTEDLDLEDDFVTDYEPDVDPYAESAVSYDFSKIKIQINGKDVTLPGKIDGIVDSIEFDEEQIEPGEYGYGYNEDYTVSVSVYNNTDKTMSAKDCDITNLYVMGESNIKITVDDITYDDDIQKVVEKYGCKLEDSQAGFVDIENKDGYEYISFYYEDGKIYEIDLGF